MSEHEASSGSSPAAVESGATRRRTDVAWNHVQELGKNTLKCCYCLKIFGGGGIHRMKKHLANIKGDVTPCKKVPLNVMLQVKADLEGSAYESHKRQLTLERGFFPLLSPVDEDVKDARGPSFGKEDARGPSFGKEEECPSKKLKGILEKVQPSIKCDIVGEDAIERAWIAIAKWFYDADIPFSACNSPYFQAMFDSVLAVGVGFKAPTFHDLRGNLLKKSVKELKAKVDSFREEWKRFGCTIMVDGWVDKEGRTLINFFVYCSKGTVFLKSVDASEYVKSGEMLSNLLCGVVEEVGVKNVVQVVTNDVSNSELAGQLLSVKYPHIFWTPCAACYVNLMLKEIAEIGEVKAVIDHACFITTFIYNHSFVSSLMRKFTNGKEIIHPAKTRFATQFTTLQSLHNCKDQLRAMVTSGEWIQSKWISQKNQKAMVATDLILSNTFWDKCLIIVTVFEPLVRVLRVVDSGERPAMGYIFEIMRRAMNAITKTFKGFGMDAQPFISIIDSRWENQLSRPLHLAGHWFNPIFFYHMDEETRSITLQGVLDCVERLTCGDANLQLQIKKEMDLYRDSLDLFGRPVAIAARYTMAPDAWWELYGLCAPHLHDIALKILGQTCSSSGCERNRSIFERIHGKKMNRLEHQRLSDLVYVHYNLRLLNGKKKKKQFFDPISFDDIDVMADWVVEEEPSFISEEDVDSWIEMDQPQSSNCGREDDDFALFGTLNKGA